MHTACLTWTDHSSLVHLLLLPGFWLCPVTTLLLCSLITACHLATWFHNILKAPLWRWLGGLHCIKSLHIKAGSSDSHDNYSVSSSHTSIKGKGQIFSRGFYPKWHTINQLPRPSRRPPVPQVWHETCQSDEHMREYKHVWAMGTPSQSHNGECMTTVLYVQ